MSENLLEISSDELEDKYGINEADIPEKFRDEMAKKVRLADLIKSYKELEKKLSQANQYERKPIDETDMSEFYKLFGVPETPDAYEISVNSKDLDVDKDVNQRLFDAKFNNQQAQLVYQLAEERLLPAITQMAANFEANKQLDKLVAEFGGEEKWNEVSRQMSMWGKKNLSDEIYNALGSTYEGVKVLYDMMKNGEPSFNKKDDVLGSGISEQKLKEMMKDERYWKDKDPSYISMISNGFKKLYPNEE